MGLHPGPRSVPPPEVSGSAEAFRPVHDGALGRGAWAVIRAGPGSDRA